VCPSADADDAIGAVKPHQIDPVLPMPSPQHADFQAKYGHQKGARAGLLMVDTVSLVFDTVF
jgi:hypothetical protein